MTYEEILDVEIQKMTLVEKFKMLLNNKKENNALKNRILETLEVENLEFLDISSTEIREHLINNCVPDKVKEYIVKNGLYKY